MFVAYVCSSYYTFVRYIAFEYDRQVIYLRVEVFLVGDPVFGGTVVTRCIGVYFSFGAYSHILQFEPLVCPRVLDGVVIDERLHAAYGVYAAYVGCAAVEVVFCSEEDVVRGEGKEDGRYFAEAVSDGKDVDHVLSCS